MIFRLRLFLLPFFSLLLSSCGPKLSSLKSASPSSPESPLPNLEPCDTNGSHVIFSIQVDGADIGREVRTDVVEQGENGPERFILSHLVKNEKMGNVIFQRVHVRIERTSLDSGALIRTSFVKKDQVSVDTVEVLKDAEVFERRIESNSSFKKATSARSDKIALSGTEVIGFRLIDVCRKHILSHSSSPFALSYFDANLNAPLRLVVSVPRPSSFLLDGQQIEGFWVDVSKSEDRSLIAQYFFDSSGILFAERYPEFHELRTRLVGSLSSPTDTSELIVGLHSNAYIYDPNIATRATYRLTSTPDRLDKLDMLSEPVNQSVKRLSDNELELTVHAGAPDDREPPVDADLGSSFYIRPDDAYIKNALLYLKSAGKKGRLSEMRRLNSTSVIARSSIIKNRKSFWSDNDKVAGLVMLYVSSLLPDKRHTFSMSDAVFTLSEGAGDCTEHAVLFASLMRAHGIPTRLVTGMLLMPGGVWAYHMWNSYWDGVSWKAIDPSTRTYRPGALYVSLGRGASMFNEVRDRLADFMWRTFSGVSFDLVEASNNGESLFLARPVGAGRDLGETALFNAVVLSDRGDYLGALNLLDENIPTASRSISVKLLRIELLNNAHRYDMALENIISLRRETSADENTHLLDRFEFEALLHIGKFQEALSLLSKFQSDSAISRSDKLLFEAKYFFFSGDRSKAISLINLSLSNNAVPESSRDDFLLLYAEFISLLDDADSSLLAKAYFSAFEAVSNRHFVNARSLFVFSRIVFKLGRPLLALWLTDHALTLMPDDDALRKYNHRLSSIDISCP